MTPVVDITGLRVVARGSDGRDAAIVDDINFSVFRGEVMALIGESGSGKTTIALSTMGYSRPGCRIAGGSITVCGIPVLSLDRRGLQALRGHTVAYIAQSAAAAFNPSRTIMSQVIESARIHRTMTAAQARKKARELFRDLALPDPDHIGDRYPHQVSGGQLQRLLAAMALVNDPELVIFDEPTTALDVTTQIEVLRAFKTVIRERRTTGIYVTHDLAVVAQIADKIAVLRDGRLREIGSAEQIITMPANAYTKSLISAAVPATRASALPAGDGALAPPLLEVRGLLAGYGTVGPDGLPIATALDDVSFKIRRGSTLGVIGESGSGKSTLARVIAGLLPLSRGTVLLDGQPMAPDIAKRTREQLRRVQIVFQMADTALNPAHTIGQILERPLTFYHGLDGRRRQQRVGRLLDLVKLPSKLAERYPDELSGGQKQRANLARALAADPDLILCDEVTSALDTVVGEAILDLLVELRRELGVSYMFISHDLGTVKAISDEIMVLYAGRKVEAGRSAAVLQRPHHPYSDLLIASVPELRPGWLDGLAKVAALSDAGQTIQVTKSACPFFGRCELRLPGICDVTLPPVRHLSKDCDILCHRQESELMALQTT